MDYIIHSKKTREIIARVLNPENTNILNNVITFRSNGMLVQFLESDVYLTSNNKIRTI